MESLILSAQLFLLLVLVVVELCTALVLTEEWCVGTTARNGLRGLCGRCSLAHAHVLCGHARTSVQPLQCLPCARLHRPRRPHRLHRAQRLPLQAVVPAHPHACALMHGG